MAREILIWKIMPGLIFLALWLDGWFFPLILLPLLYVILVEKKNLDCLGFSRHNLRYPLVLSMVIVFILIGVYSPIFFYYLSDLLNWGTFDIYDIFLDVFWYPMYEEIAYRGFFLTHFATLDKSYISTRNLIVNLIQSLLFLSIHKHHLSTPLVLVPVFLLGLLNGFMFIKTRNVYGCILSHSILNSFALTLRYLRA